jgi:gluconokinase
MEDLMNMGGNILPGAEGLTFIPYVFGERSYIADAGNIQGAFTGINSSHDQKHFIKAILEGIVFNLYSIYQKLLPNKSAKEVFITGGITESMHWLQIAADIFGTDIHVVKNPDASVRGITSLMRKSLGIIQNYGDIVPENEHQIIQHNKSVHESYKRVYERFTNIQEQLIKGDVSMDSF